MSHLPQGEDKTIESFDFEVNQKCDRNINIRITEDEINRFSKHAKQIGIPFAKWVRDSLKIAYMHERALFRRIEDARLNERGYRADRITEKKRREICKNEKIPAYYL